MKIPMMLQRAALVTAAVSALIVGATGTANASASSIATPAAASAVSSAGVIHEAVPTREGGMVVQVVSGTAGTKSVAVEPAPRVSYTIKFSHARTKQLFDAAVLGATSTITAICLAVAPAAARALCAPAAGLIGILLRNAGQPGPNDCLAVTLEARIGWPPVRVRGGYVNC